MFCQTLRIGVSIGQLGHRAGKLVQRLEKDREVLKETEKDRAALPRKMDEERRIRAPRKSDRIGSD